MTIGEFQLQRFDDTGAGWCLEHGWIIFPYILGIIIPTAGYCHIHYLVGGLEHEFFDFPFSWECHTPIWRTPSFFRGVGQPPTRGYCSKSSRLSTIINVRWLLFNIRSHFFHIHHGPGQPPTRGYQITPHRGVVQKGTTPPWSTRRKSWPAQIKRIGFLRRCRLGGNDLGSESLHGLVLLGKSSPETRVIFPWNMGLSGKLSLKPIHWERWNDETCVFCDKLHVEI